MQDSVSAAGSHPKLTSLTNGNVVIVWDESISIGNKPGKKIGIQVRNKEGRSELKTYLTDDNTLASYPVLWPLNEHTSIVAYTAKSGDKPVVTYQLIDIE